MELPRQRRKQDHEKNTAEDRMSEPAVREKNVRYIHPYPGYDIERPLEAGMVLSIETTMNHPKRGLVKIEDTVLVTESGWKGLGDGVRGWQATAK